MAMHNNQLFAGKADNDGGNENLSFELEISNDRKKETNSVLNDETNDEKCSQVKDEYVGVQFDNNKQSNTGSNTRVHLVWKDLSVDGILPPASCTSRLKSCCNKEKRNALSGKKPILKNVSGDVKPGSLLAIMGASGAGKTTMLNVLAYQNRQGMDIKGSVLVNNKEIKGKIRYISAYVQQHNIFIGTLTVKEHLTFQAILRLGSSYTRKEKKQRVMDVMNQLGLMKCQDVIIGVPGRITGGISGGELKRLAFASEIITNPKLLFVDEPTSGLDAFMAESCIKALQKLANQGQTICATIHQPSSETFQLFDRLLLLSEGRVAFQGTATDAKEFFMGVGFPCPSNYNPADHYIHTLAVIPGEEEDCRRKAEMICDNFDESEYNGKDSYVENIHDLSSSIIKATYLQGYFTQLRAVMWRAHRASTREPLVNKVKIIRTVLISVFIGLVFLRQDNNQDGVSNVNGAIFFMIMMISLSTVNSVACLFPPQLPVFLQEHSIKMYRVDVYFFGKQLAELPWNLVLISFQSVLIYWMTGMHNSAKHFFIFFGICHMTSQCSYSYGLLISALSPTEQFAAAITIPLVLPFLLMGGFFMSDGSVPVYFIWIRYLSWMGYAFELGQINQWAEFGPIACTNDSDACFSDGLSVLKANGYNQDNFNRSVGAMLGLTVGYRLLALLALLFRARSR